MQISVRMLTIRNSSFIHPNEEVIPEVSYQKETKTILQCIMHPDMKFLLLDTDS